MIRPKSCMHDVLCKFLEKFIGFNSNQNVFQHDFAFSKLSISLYVRCNVWKSNHLLNYIFLTTFFHWFDDRDVAASLNLLFRISTYIGYYYGTLFGISQFLKDLGLTLQIDLDKAWTSSSFFKCQQQRNVVIQKTWCMHFHEKLTTNSFVKVKSMFQHAVRKITTYLSSRT